MITITIEGNAESVRREMQALLGDAGRAGPSSGGHVVFVDVDETPPRTVAQPEAEPVEETAAEPEQPRRGRGRPRKNPVTIDGEATVVSETTTAPQEQQIDLEEVIAAKSEPEIAHYVELPADATGDQVAEAFAGVRGAAAQLSQPADPDKGWTHDDAKTVARAMYVRLNSLQQHELDEKLHTNLQKFGVQRIKDLALEQIEAFVRAVEAEVA
jgi:hypothetical protein